MLFPSVSIVLLRKMNTTVEKYPANTVQIASDNRKCVAADRLSLHLPKQAASTRPGLG